MKLNPAATYWQKSSSCGVSSGSGLLFSSASERALAPATRIWLSVRKFLPSASSGASRAGLPPRLRKGTTFWLFCSLAMWCIPFGVLGVWCLFLEHIIFWYVFKARWVVLFFGGEL